MKNRIIIWVLLVLLPLGASAQIIIKGLVKDDLGEPLFGATVSEVDNVTNGVTTDINGNFSITVKSDKAKIKISYIGFVDKIATVTSSPMDINLEVDDRVLPEVQVVAIGFGTKSRISNVASVSQIDNKMIRQSPSVSIQNALAGRLPGLFQVQASGQPGNDAASLFIRGISTFSGASTEPLVLVDDVESDVQTLTQMDPNEVESVSILKDAGSTAIFGIKGANGVILITTKRGKEGPARITLRTDIGLQQPTYKRKSLSSYESLKLIRESLLNSNPGTDPGVGEPMLYSLEALDHFRRGDNPYLYPDVDWYSEIFKDIALQEKQTVDIQGGTKAVKYFLSMGYLNQGGLLKDIKKKENFNNDYYLRRYNIRSNIDISITKDLTLKLGASGVMDEINEPHLPDPRVIGGAFPFFKRISSGMLTSWKYPVKNPNGTYGGKSGNVTTNPLALLEQGGYKRKFNNNINGNITVDQKLGFVTPGLKVRGMLALTNNWYWRRELTRGTFCEFEYDPESSSYQPTVVDQYVLPPLKSAAISIDPFLKLNSRVDLSYSRRFGDHNVSGIVLANWTSDRRGGETPGNVVSYSGRLSYDYKSKYIFELNGSYSGSDRFQADNRFDFFPAVSAGWNISEESFVKNAFKKIKIDYFKIRGSYGITGTDEFPSGRSYFYVESYQKLYDYYFGESATRTNDLVLAALANNSVKWETEKKLDIGVDIRMLKNRLGLTFDYFRNKREGILAIRGSLVDYAGYTKVNNDINPMPPMNIGITENKGYDGEISWRDNIGKDFTYNIRATVSKAKNKIIEMDEATSIYPNQMKTGQPIGSIFGYIWDGYYQSWDDIANSPTDENRKNLSPGDLKYKDISGPDGVPDGVIDEYDKIKIGIKRPDFTYGFSLGFSYKNFDISALFQGATGASLSAESMLQIGNNNGQPAEIHKKRWTNYDKYDYLITDPQQLIEMNRNAEFPRLGGDNAATSTFWLRSTNYLRLKSVEVGYNLPSKWFKALKIQSFRLFASGQNLVTWSDLNIYQVDPESSTTDNPYQNYPQQRVYNFGCQIVF